MLPGVDDIAVLVFDTPGVEALHLALKPGNRGLWTVALLSIVRSLIFKASLHQQHLPSDWKTAHITPVFKKGSRKNPANYRPISLTSIPGA